VFNVKIYYTRRNFKWECTESIKKKKKEKKKGKYFHKTKPYLTEYLRGQYAENFLLLCVLCSWIMSFRILGYNLAASTGANGLCAAGLSLVVSCLC